MGIIRGDKAKQFSLHQMWNWNATRYCAIRLDHTERYCAIRLDHTERYCAIRLDHTERPTKTRHYQ